MRTLMIFVAVAMFSATLSHASVATSSTLRQVDVSQPGGDDPMRWYDDMVSTMQHQYDGGRLAKKVRHLPDQPTTVPLDGSAVGPAPTMGCDICRTLTNTVIGTFSNNTKTAKAEKEINKICTSFNKTVEGGKLCMDIADAVVHFLNKQLHVSASHENISMILCGSLIPVCKVPCCVTENQPEQIHIGFPTGGDVVADASMQVTWATYSKAVLSTVVYWKADGSGVEHNATALVTTYTRSGWMGWLSGAVMTNLEANTTYSYKVGDLAHRDDASFWSATINFTTFPSNMGTPVRPLRVASFCDMGIGGTHFETINAIKGLIDRGEVDMILHGGDISYADGDSYRFDRFMRQMQPLTSRVPYMAIPGNHEILFNFTAYRTRFWMQPRPGHGASNDALFYTFSVGPNIRFVMMNSESFIDLPEIDAEQVAWATNVLTEAKANRQFTMAAFHRPMYCTSPGPACTWEREYLQGQVESIFVQNNVSVIHTGHVHNYERTYPVAGKIRQGTSYEDTTAPVSFVNGAPGCDEGLNGFGDHHGKRRPDWSAKRIEKTSFMLSTIHSEPRGDTGKMKHTAHIQQTQSTDYAVLDEIVLTKTL